MKSVKFLAFMVLSGMVMGCSKHVEPVKMQEIRIGIGNVRSGSLETKSVNDVLGGTAPTGVVELSLRGVDVATRSYRARVGESMSVPVGRYKVTGSYEPTVQGTAVFNAVYQEPSYSISQEIDVQEGVSEYSVPAEYNCFAMIIDYNECAKYRWKGWGGEFSDLLWMKRVGDFGVAYFSTQNRWSAGESSFTLLAVPADTERKESAEYLLLHESSINGVKVQSGKWYKFSPVDVTFQEGGIGVELPEWGAGN